MYPFPIIAEISGDIIFLIVIGAIAGLQKLFEYMKKSKEEQEENTNLPRPTPRQRRPDYPTQPLPGNYQKKRTAPKTVLNKAETPRQATMSQPYDRQPQTAPAPAPLPVQNVAPQPSYSAPNPYSPDAIAHAEQQAAASLQNLSDAEKAALASLKTNKTQSSKAQTSVTKMSHSRHSHHMSGKELKTWMQHPNALKTAVLFKEILGSPKALQ